MLFMLRSVSLYPHLKQWMYSTVLNTIMLPCTVGKTDHKTIHLCCLCLFGGSPQERLLSLRPCSRFFSSTEGWNSGAGFNQQILTRSTQHNRPSSTPLPTFKLRSYFAFCIYVTLQYQLGSAPLSKITPAQLIDFWKLDSSAQCLELTALRHTLMN